MNVLKASVVMVATVLGVSLAPQTCEAAEPDMRLGKFEGNFCGFDARFDLTSREGDTWVFQGKVFIKATGQYDTITIKQYADNHLRIVRHLSGERAGTNQWVDTYPPETLKTKSGQTYVNFKVKSAGGYGSKPLGHLHMPVIK